MALGKKNAFGCAGFDKPVEQGRKIREASAQVIHLPPMLPSVEGPPAPSFSLWFLLPVPLPLSPERPRPPQRAGPLLADLTRPWPTVSRSGWARVLFARDGGGDSSDPNPHQQTQPVPCPGPSQRGAPRHLHAFSAESTAVVGATGCQERRGETTLEQARSPDIGTDDGNAVLLSYSCEPPHRALGDRWKPAFMCSNC